MRWRRPVTAHAVVAWRAPRETVAAALVAEQVPAAVGPVEDGWTRVRLLVHDDTVIEPRGRAVLDLLDDLARTLDALAAVCVVGEWAERELLVVAPGSPVVSARIPGVASDEPPSRQEWAQVLRTLDNLSALEPVLTAATPPGLLSKKQWPSAAMSDRRHRAVAHAASLPAALFEPDAVAADGIEREVVLARRVEAPDVAVVAGALGSPLQCARLGGVTAVTTDPIEGRQITPIAVSLGSGRDAVLLLWRQDSARGYQLVRRGDVLDTHVWDTSWQVVELAPDLDPEFRAELSQALAPAEGDAELLVRHFASVDVDLVALRALLRRPADGRVVADLCALLGVDPQVADVVEGDREFASLPAVTRVEPTSTASAIWAAAKAPRENDPWIVKASRAKPWWWRVADLVWVVAAVLWIADLWPGGGVVARVGCAVLGLTALWSLYDAVTPASAGAAREATDVS